MHTALMHIWHNIDKIDDPESSQAIVLAVTIVKNCAYALMDGAAREPDPAETKKDFDATGLEEALHIMPASTIIKVVNKLGGENKNIFLLKYAYKFSRRKIAKTLDDTEANIAARLYKAQRRLRALLLRGGFR